MKSRRGARDEARLAFVQAVQVHDGWAGRDAFTVLELGFGLGVNFLHTVEAWQRDPHRSRRLFYVGIDAHPVAADELSRALRQLDCLGPAQDEVALAAQQLTSQWPMALPGIHRLDFCDGQVQLLLAFGDAGVLLRKLQVAADAVYLDSFAPARNPDAWSAELIRGMARLCRPQARLASQSCAAPVLQALADAGFEVSTVPGFAGNPLRLLACYRPRWRRVEPPAAPLQWSERTAIVVGAGLAGSAQAAALAARGWQVTVFDRGLPRGPLAGSVQPVCAEHMHLSSDDNPLARLSRAGLLNSRRARWLGPPGFRSAGKLMLAADARELSAFCATLQRLGFPAAFASVLDAGQASDAAGIVLSRGGLWLPMAGSADPVSLCDRWLAGSDAIVLRTGTVIERLQQVDGGWQVFDQQGRCLAQASVLVLANADDAVRLAGLPSSGIRRMAGQTTRLRSPLLQGLRCTLGGDAYACPVDAGSVLVGATFEPVDGFVPGDAGDQSNQRRLARGLGLGNDAQALRATVLASHGGVRCSLPDRMPAIGPMPDVEAITAQADQLHRNARLPLPRRAGLYGSFAMGARGLLHAPLAADLLVAMIEGDPLPLERDLLATVDPARGLEHHIRRLGRR